MKSQTALEYLMLITLGMVIVIPVFYYSLTYSSDAIKNEQAQDAVNTLAKTADYVYSLGVGSSAKVLITIPQNVKNSSVEGKVILIKLELSSGVTDIKATTKANVTGGIPTVAGTYTMFLNMTGTMVEIQRG